MIILLTQNQQTIIDNEDFDRLSQYNWYAYWDKTTFRARAWFDGKTL